MKLLETSSMVIQNMEKNIVHFNQSQFTKALGFHKTIYSFKYSHN